MGIFKRFLLFNCTLLAVTALFFSQAYAAAALTVTPDPLYGSEDYPTPEENWPTDTLYEIATGQETGTGGENGVLAAIATYIGDSTEMYKSDTVWPEEPDSDGNWPDSVGSVESGTLSESYEISYDLPNPGDDDPSAGTLSWTLNTPYISEGAFLLVKDGNADPVWYLFDLATWDGMEDIRLEGFWNNTNGGISHVSLFGSATIPELPGTGVPIPSSAYLLGSALLLLPAVLRRKQKRN